MTGVKSADVVTESQKALTTGVRSADIIIES
jgi:hypothetical protein